MQQVLAYESDLLEYDDIFDGSRRRRGAHRRSCVTRPGRELEEILALGGAFDAVETLKSRLVSSMAERTRRIEAGDQVVVGVNRFTETEPSPLGGEGAILRVDPRRRGRGGRCDAPLACANGTTAAVAAALAELRAAAEGGENIMPASIALARAGGTTGEWGRDA